MQGYSHALTGAAGWLAITSSVTVPASQVIGFLPDKLPLSTNLIGASPEIALVGAVLCAGAALVPDMDHHNGTIAHSLPPFTQVACRGFEAVSGGHRHGTHSLLGILAFTLLAWLASFITIVVDGRTVALGAGIVAVPLVAFALKGLGIRLGRRHSILNTAVGPWLISLGTAGAATYFLDYTWSWLPLAVGLGAFIHCLGDALTVQGVPWLWPLNPSPPKALGKVPVLGAVANISWQRNGYFRLPLLGETTSFRETAFAVLVAVYVLLVVLYSMGVQLGM